MLYRIRETGAVLTQGEIRKLHSNISFPAVWDSSTCDAIGVDPVLTSPQPETTRFQTAYLDGVEQDALGNWVQKWLVSDWDVETIAAATETQWSQVRTQRNKLLADSDWTQLPDSPLSIIDKADWSTYRQQLRDVTLQADPFNIVWPSMEPNE
jgi:hypothetical protein